MTGTNFPWNAKNVGLPRRQRVKRPYQMHEKMQGVNTAPLRSNLVSVVFAFIASGIANAPPPGNSIPYERRGKPGLSDNSVNKTGEPMP